MAMVVIDFTTGWDAQTGQFPTESIPRWMVPKFSRMIVVDRVTIRSIFRHCGHRVRRSPLMTCSTGEWSCHGPRTTRTERRCRLLCRSGILQRWHSSTNGLQGVAFIDANTSLLLPTLLEQLPNFSTVTTSDRPVSTIRCRSSRSGSRSIKATLRRWRN